MFSIFRLDVKDKSAANANKTNTIAEKRFSFWEF
jgi:hypothetical protein